MKDTLLIRTRNNTPLERADGYDMLWGHLDKIGNLEDCPFPLEGPNYKVILFGKCDRGEFSKGEETFAVVDHVSVCGHRVHQRVSFQEGVEDIDHYGTKFIGYSYSIQDWKNRIETFRNFLYPVCDMFEHLRWTHFHAGERTASRKQSLKRFDALMQYNYVNWQEFVSRADFEKAIKSPEDLNLSLRKKLIAPVATGG